MENLAKEYIYDNNLYIEREKTRLEFIRKFPLENLENLKLEEKPNNSIEIVAIDISSKKNTIEGLNKIMGCCQITKGSLKRSR